MRQSIVTKYIGPGNVRGSRVSAVSTSGVRTVMEWDYELSTDENHMAVARKLAAKLNWSGTWQAGAMPKGRVFVNLDADQFTI